MEGRHGSVVIPSFGGNNYINNARGGGGMHPLPSLHNRPVNCDLTNAGSVSGGGEESIRKVDTTVVGTEVCLPGGFKDGGRRTNRGVIGGGDGVGDRGVGAVGKG